MEKYYMFFDRICGNVPYSYLAKKRVTTRKNNKDPLVRWQLVKVHHEECNDILFFFFFTFFNMIML